MWRAVHGSQGADLTARAEEYIGIHWWEEVKRTNCFFMREREREKERERRGKGVSGWMFGQSGGADAKGLFKEG
jgi:hypothetical protein